MSQPSPNSQSDKIKSASLTSEGGSLTTVSPVLSRRGKLPSCSADSRASDSGIGFNDFPGIAINTEVEDVEADNANFANNGDGLPQRPPTTPDTEGPSDLRLTIKRSSSPQRVPCDNGDAKRILKAPRPSLVDGHSRSDRSSTELSPDSPGTLSSKYVIANILERLFNDHVKKDKNWEPSGRYTAKPSQRHSKNLVQMEEDIGKTLTRKHKVREDARRVLEMFLENSLSTDPNFNPSGHYRAQARKHETTPLSRAGGTSDSPSPMSQWLVPPQASPLGAISPVQMRRPLSTIVQDESAVERGSDVSAFTLQRNSYYDAVYHEGGPEGFTSTDDYCYSEVTGAIQDNVRLATPEDENDMSPISLIYLGKPTTEASTEGKTIRTDLEAVDNGIHIHKHIEEDRPLSSSTSLSSILDDGGIGDLGLENRRKKSFFTKATQRLRHAFNRRAQRSDSRSESEGDKHSIKPRTKRKKKKGLSIKKKRGSNADVVDVKLLKSHQHKIKLHGVAQLDGDGLNANIWREDGLEGERYKHRLAHIDKASTLPTKPSDYNKSSTEKSREKEKAKEKRDKEMKELMKEAKKTRKAADRSESNRSNDSLFKRWTLKRSNKVDSPAGDRKSFSLGSKLRKSKKKGSMELEYSVSSPTPVMTISGGDTARQRTHFSDERLQTQQALSADSLQVPQNQQRSKSADEIPSPSLVNQPAIGKNGQPTFNLTPQHSRSRSAQDTTSPFSINDSSQPSSTSPKITLGFSGLETTHSLSPGPQRRYARNAPVGGGRLASAGVPVRRHTTEVPSFDLANAHNRSIDSRAASRRLYHAGAAGTTSPQRSGGLGGGLRPAGMTASSSSERSGGLGPAGLTSSKPAATHGPRDGLKLPLNVDATVNRTQSVRTSGDGRRVLRTVTSLNEVISLDQRKSNKATPSDLESDSEIERISNIPQNMRTQKEKDKLYQHIAARISKLIRNMEEQDAAQSSAYNTPLDDGRGFSVGNIPAPAAAPSSAPSHSTQSSSLERNSSFLSARSATSSSPWGHTETMELHVAGGGITVDASTTKIDNIPESSLTEEMSETTISPTITNQQLATYLKNKGDDIHQFRPEFSAMFGGVVRQNLSNYDVFEQVVDMNTNNEVPYINRIASVFRITLDAIRYLGKTGEAANRVKDNALTYIENKFAEYIIRNGGWDSMIEESSSELEVD